MRCRREGLGVCQGAAAPVTLVGGCTSPTVIPAQGGTFTGTTSGTSVLAGSCGSSGSAPERVFQWTPTVSGTATIQSATSFMRPVSAGHVEAVARPLRVGRTVIHLETDVVDADDRLVARVTQSQAVL